MKKILILLLLLVSSAFAQTETDTTYTSKYMGREIDSLLDLSATYDDSISALRAAIEAGAAPDSVIYPYETVPWDKVANDDVTLTGTQDITGQKNFSNSKTVFSGDSVGLRGDVRIDGLVSFSGGYGDINGNGSMSASDASKYNSYLSQSAYLTRDEIMRGDIDGDGSLDVNDFQMFILLNGYTIEDPNIDSLKKYAIRYVNSRSWYYSFDDYTVTGSLLVEDSLKTTNYNFPVSDGISGQVQKTDGNGNLYWASDLTGSGGSAYTDAVTINGWITTGDSIVTLDAVDSLLKISGSTYKLSYSGSAIDDWLGGLSAWTDQLNSSSLLMKIGKPGRQIYFNNNLGGNSDYWLLDYIQHPFNLPYSNQIMREFRTDYFNDTLKTFQSIANLTFLDGTGTPIWHPDGFSYVHNQNQLGVGDLPDSIPAVFNGNGVVGVQFAISEANKTAGAKRFPMKVKGFEFKFGSTPYYTYPVVYGYYSDLTTNTPNLETAYHFYGNGDYPSYFGGNIITDGYIRVQDSIIIGSSTVKIYPDSITVGGTRLAKITEAGTGSVDTNDVKGIIYEYIQDSSAVSNYTQSQIDSLLALAGTAKQKNDTTASTGYATQYDLTQVQGNADTTHYVAWNKVIGLQDSLQALRSMLYSILDAVSACCDLSDNIPPDPVTNLVATPKSTTRDSVYWTATGSADANWYRIYRKTTTRDSTTATKIDSVAFGTNYYVNTGLTANTVYWYWVKVVDDSGNVSNWCVGDSAKTFTAAASDTGFYKFDAEDGLANLVLTNGTFITDTSGFSHTGSKSYKFRGNGTTAGVFADIYPFPSGYGSEATIWVSYYVYIPSSTTTNVTSGDYQYLTLFGDAADINGDAGWLGISTDGSSNIDNWVKPWGTELATGFATNTWLKVEIKYVQGTGTNGQDSIWVNGTPIYGNSTATGTVTTSRFRFGYPGGSSWRPLSGEAIYFDDIILSTHRLPLD